MMQCQGQHDSGSPIISQCVSVYLRDGTVAFNQIPDGKIRILTTGIVDGSAAWSSDKSVFVVIGKKERFILSRMLFPVAYFFNREGDIIFKVSEDLPQFKVC